MLYNDATPKTYMATGPAYPGEDAHTAMAENTVYSLAGHLLNTPAQGVGPAAGPAPGHGFEHEPLDSAEQASQHVVQTVAQDQALRPGAAGATY
jgi:hypothetical protein